MQFMQAYTPVGEAVLDPIGLEDDPVLAVILEEAGENLTVIDRLPLGGTE